MRSTLDREGRLIAEPPPIDDVNETTLLHGEGHAVRIGHTDLRNSELIAAGTFVRNDEDADRNRAAFYSTGEIFIALGNALATERGGAIRSERIDVEIRAALCCDELEPPDAGAQRRAKPILRIGSGQRAIVHDGAGCVVLRLRTRRRALSAAATATLRARCALCPDSGDAVALRLRRIVGALRIVVVTATARGRATTAAVVARCALRPRTRDRVAFGLRDFGALRVVVVTTAARGVATSAE